MSAPICRTETTAPTVKPTAAPTYMPTAVLTYMPTMEPTESPTGAPTNSPTVIILPCKAKSGNDCLGGQAPTCPDIRTLDSAFGADNGDLCEDGYWLTPGMTSDFPLSVSVSAEHVTVFLLIEYCVLKHPPLAEYCVLKYSHWLNIVY
jgi:hypothetical protein